METIYTWYGHATHGLKVGENRLVIDPYFSGNPATTLKPEQVSADYILITHGHGDHIGDTVSIAKRTDALCVSNAEISAWLRDKGLRTHAQHIGGGHRYPFGYLKLTPALHGSALPDGSYGGNPAGFLLTTPDEKRIYIAGDTGLFGDMQLIGDEGLDLAVIPIGDNYTMGPSDAAEAVNLLQPKLAIPMHYNTWPVIAQSPDGFKQDVENRFKIPVHIMNPGDSYTL